MTIRNLGRAPLPSTPTEVFSLIQNGASNSVPYSTLLRYVHRFDWLQLAARAIPDERDAASYPSSFSIWGLDGRAGLRVFGEFTPVHPGDEESVFLELARSTKIWGLGRAGAPMPFIIFPRPEPFNRSFLPSVLR